MSDNADLFEEIKTIILEKIAETKLSGYWHPMYGGLMFELEEGNRKSGIGGVFISRNHISFEYSSGYKLSDPDNILEGGGKYRRHIKIRNFNDVDDKQLVNFFKQAYENALQLLNNN